MHCANISLVVGAQPAMRFAQVMVYVSARAHVCTCFQYLRDCWTHRAEIWCFTLIRFTPVFIRDIGTSECATVHSFFKHIRLLPVVQRIKRVLLLDYPDYS